MPIFHDIADSPPSRSYKPTEVASDDGHEHGLPLESDWAGNSLYRPLDAIEAMRAEEEERPRSRAELIERIKRGNSRPNSRPTSPTWIFKHDFAKRPPSRASNSPSSQPRSLLASPEMQESPKSTDSHGWCNQAAGLEIERPRSALHSGDFREDKSNENGGDESLGLLATSPVAPWHNEFPPFLAARAPERLPQRRQKVQAQSSLSQFAFLPPTSPLVHAANNSDLEDSAAYPIPQRQSRSPQADSRRHTYSPQSLQAWGSSAFGSQPSTLRPVPSMRRESTFPYQAHQPRRSITALSQSISNFIPQTTPGRPRGFSNASESSPLHHAPMVGSYEESILRGRMSTTPSRPLHFVAQIGVLGKGKCKSSLRCPPHATVPFPAVFYSYGSGGGPMVDNQPSPYVGLIDIENNVPAPKEKREESRRRQRLASPTPNGSRDNSLGPSRPVESSTADLNLLEKKRRLRKRSRSPRAPPGGCYRIPQQGQLQIILKNPNKTAVKLFLVPYDLSDMEPGTKTFIRQRSYSAGPIVDMPLSAPTVVPRASLTCSEDPRDRPVLRYLVHIHVCCTGKGRYYLYKSIRVVFANRVPDGKEKLRNEIQLPEPRFSAYKPERTQHQNPATFALSSAKSLADKRTARRKSTPLDLAGGMSLGAADGLEAWPSSLGKTVIPNPFLLNKLETVDNRQSSRDRESQVQVEDMSISPVAVPTRSGRNDANSAWEARRANPLLLHGQSDATSLDFELGRSESPSNMPNKISEGLLARQLRGLSVECEQIADVQNDA